MAENRINHDQTCCHYQRNAAPLTVLIDSNCINSRKESMLTVLNLNWAEYQRGLTVEIQFADSEDQVSDVSMHGLRFSWESQIKDSKKGRKTNNELNLPVTASSSWQTRPTTWLCWRRVVILSRILVQSVLLAPLISQLVFSQNHQVSWAAAVRDIFQLSNIFFLASLQISFDLNTVYFYAILLSFERRGEKLVLISEQDRVRVVMCQNYGGPFSKTSRIVSELMLTRTGDSEQINQNKLDLGVE